VAIQLANFGALQQATEDMRCFAHESAGVVSNQPIDGYIESVIDMLTQVARHDQGRMLLLGANFMNNFWVYYQVKQFGGAERKGDESDLNQRVELFSRASKLLRYMVHVKLPNSAEHIAILNEFELFNELYRGLIHATQNNYIEM